MAKVLGVGGVFFKTEDPKALAEWYARWLGLELDPTFNGTSFAPSDMPAGGYTVWSPFEDGTRYFDPSASPFMINLIVDDLTEALEQVVSGGAELAGEPETFDYGRFGWFLDPAGNKVELWQPS
jgi:predicted enzyme related to lactoylglutathione lyase